MQSGWFYLGGVIFLIIQFDRSSQLLNEIRRLLIKAHENQFLATSINEIYSILKITNEDKYGFSTVYGGGIRNSGGDIIRILKMIWIMEYALRKMIIHGLIFSLQLRKLVKDYISILIVFQFDMSRKMT